MCSICRQSPCNPRCPNYEPIVVAKCEICGDEIYEGETMYVLGESIFCESCVSDGITVAEVEYE